MSKSISVDGIMRPMHNSDGGVIHATEAGIINFWRWFGDSRVIDDAGRPRVLFHGPTKGRNFDAFRVPAFFTSSEEYADRYLDADDEGRPMALYVRLMSPLILDARTHEMGADVEELANCPDWVAARMAEGVDGLIILDGDISDFVAFHQHQVKSATHNCGAFNESSPCFRDSNGVGRRVDVSEVTP